MVGIMLLQSNVRCNMATFFSFTVGVYIILVQKFQFWKNTTMSMLLKCLTKQKSDDDP